MAKDEFFQNVRATVQFVAPRIDRDNPYNKPSELKRILNETTIWITPMAVEGFDLHDFEDLSQEDREALSNDVETFTRVANSVSDEGPVTNKHIETALPVFLNIFKFVKKEMLGEWVGAASKLVDQARGWAQAQDWPTKTYTTRISEDLLGTYELQKLVFAAEGTSLVLEPLGRFGLEVDGIFDLAVLPDYDAVRIVRRNGRWTIAPLPGENRRRRWSEGSFVETVETLVRQA